MNRITVVAPAATLALVVFAAGCGGGDTVASRSAAAYDEAVAKGVPIEGGDGHGGHEHGAAAATHDGTTTATGGHAHDTSTTTGTAGHAHSGAAAGGAMPAPHTDHGAHEMRAARDAHAGHTAPAAGARSTRGEAGHAHDGGAASGTRPPGQPHAAHGATPAARQHAGGHGEHTAATTRRADPHAQHGAAASPEHMQHGTPATREHVQHGTRLDAQAQTQHGTVPHDGMQHGEHAQPHAQHVAPSAGAHAGHDMSAARAAIPPGGLWGPVPGAGAAPPQIAPALPLAPAPERSGEMSRLDPAATLRPDAADAPAAISVIESRKSAAGAHAGHGDASVPAEGDEDHREHANPPE